MTVRSTCFAPALRSTLADSCAVVPVVITSSTSNTVAPSRARPWVAAKALRKFVRRSVGVNRDCGGVQRVFLRTWLRIGMCIRRDNTVAMTSAELWGRNQLCSQNCGTGTMRSMVAFDNAGDSKLHNKLASSAATGAKPRCLDRRQAARSSASYTPSRITRSKAKRSRQQYWQPPEGSRNGPMAAPHNRQDRP